MINIKDIERKMFIKRLTGNLGKVIELDDKIICYIDEYFLSKERLYLTRNYVSKDINKEIVYVIDGKTIDNDISIRCNKVSLLINNCIFNKEFNINSDGNVFITNSVFSKIDSISSLDLSIKNSKYYYINDICASNLEVSNSEFILNNGISINSKGRVILDNTLIESKEYIYASFSNVLAYDSLLKSNDMIYLIGFNISNLNVDAPLVALNGKRIDGDNTIINLVASEKNERKYKK